MAMFRGRNHAVNTALRTALSVLVEAGLKITAEVRPRCAGRAGQGTNNGIADNDVGCRPGEGLQPSLDQVSGGGVAYALGDHKSVSGFIAPRLKHVQNQRSGRKSGTTTNDPRIVEGRCQSMCPGEHDLRLGRKLFAALAAASSKDGATGTSAHASTETVRLGAAAVVRLERTLGHDYSTGVCGRCHESS